MLMNGLSQATEQTGTARLQDLPRDSSLLQPNHLLCPRGKLSQYKFSVLEIMQMWYQTKLKLNFSGAKGKREEGKGEREVKFNVVFI
ncbi:Teneurin-1 [Manis pentadactyla]|nr:Teneurin-1 [Manis pentadactyla]